MPQERERLNALSQLNILDTDKEPMYDNLAALAATICHTSHAYISFLDNNRLWFKAAYGDVVSEMPRGNTFCEKVVEKNAELCISNITEDPSFKGHQLAVHPPFFKSYAGFPICLFEGTAVGSICVFDKDEKSLSELQLQAMRMLTKQIAQLLESRLQLSSSQSILNAYLDSSTEAFCIVDAHHEILYSNKLFNDTIYKIYQQSVKKGDTINLFFEGINWENFKIGCAKAFNGEKSHVERLVTFHNFSVWFYMQYIPIRNNLGKVVAVGFTAKNVSNERKYKDLLEETNQLAKVGGWEINYVMNECIWTDTTKQILEVAPTFVPQQHSILDFVDGDEQKKTLQNLLHTATQQDVPFNFVTTIKTSGGQIKWIKIKSNANFENGKCIRQFGAISDITHETTLRNSLQENEDRFKSMIAHSSDIIYELDANGIFTFVSPVWLRLLGHKPHEVLGKSFRQFIHPKDILACIRFYKTIADNNAKDISIEYRVLHKKGHYDWYQTKGKVVVRGGATFLTGNARNINEQILSRQELMNSEERFKSLIYNISDIITLVDASGNIQYQSASVMQKMGYSENELAGKNIFSIIHPDDIAKVQYHFSEALQVRGNTEPVEFRLLNKNGTYLHLEANGNNQMHNPAIKALIINSRDITDRKKKEAAIHVLTNRLQLATQAANMGIWDYDIVNDVLVWDNKMLDIFGVSAQDFTGNYHQWEKLLHPEDAAKTIAHLQTAFAGKKNFDTEFRILKQGRLTRHIKAQAFIEFDTNGQAVRAVGVNWDITKQKRDEQNLLLLNSAITNSQEALIITAKQADQFELPSIVYVNDAFHKITGYTAKEMIGKTLIKLTGTQTSTLAFNKLKQAIKTAISCETELQLYNKKGLPFWAEASVVPVFTKQGNLSHFIAILKDITQRKQNEIALKQSQQTLEVLFKEVPVGMLLIDRKTEKIIQANGQIQKLLGYTEAEMIGRKAGLLFNLPEIAEKIYPFIHNDVVIKDVEITIQGKTNKPIHTLVSVQILYPNGAKAVLMSFIDITDRKIAENTLKENDRILNMAHKIAKTGHYVEDLSTGKWVSSDTLDEILGIDKQFKKLTANYQKLIKPEFLDKQIQNYQLLTTGGFRYEEDYIIVRPLDGEERWVRDIAEVEFDNEGQPIRILGTLQDITERKKAIIDLRNSFTLVNEQNKRLQNFSYIVSHNIRSHSSNIMGIVSFFELPNITLQEKEEMFVHLKKAALGLDSTLTHLNELLDIQRNANIVVEKLPLHLYIDNALMVVGDTAMQKNIQITNLVETDIDLLHNKAYLESIVLNIISNAVRYSDPKKEKSTILIQSSQVQGKTVLEIIDNGVGIDLEKNKEKIFGLYKTFHGNSDARGVGLFITKNQIEALGGSIEMESSKGVGTTVRIHFK